MLAVASFKLAIEPVNVTVKNIMKNYVLIVEDNPVELKILSSFLSDGGYHPICVTNGKMALDLLHSGEYAFNLMVLDRIMPEIDGVELTRYIKANKEWQDIPIIMQSAQALDEDVAEGIDSGVTYYLTKPIERKSFLAIVRNCLQQRQSVIERVKRSKQKVRDYKHTVNSFMQREQDVKFDLRTSELITSFFIKSLSCDNYSLFAELFLETIKKIQLDGRGKHEALRCTIKLAGREDRENVDLSDRGLSSKTDSMILQKSMGSKKIVIQGSYTAIPSKSGRVAVLIRNTPTDKKIAKKANELIVILLERFDERLNHFEQELQVKEQNDKLTKKENQIHDVITSCANELHHVNTTYQNKKEQHMDLTEGITESLFSNVKGLSEDLQAQITKFFDSYQQKVMGLYGEEQITDQKFLLTIQELNNILGKVDSKEADNLTAKQLSGSSQQSVDDLLASLGL